MAKRGKATQKRTTRHTIIQATSRRTGISHSLGNIPAFERFRRDQEKARRQKEMQDLQESLAFMKWYAGQTPLPFGPEIHWNQPVFRLMYGDAPALSVMGSFGAGGRFNPGMAQMSAQFPALKAQACLYTASSLECCYTEAQPPYGDPKQYQLTPKREFVLWNLEKVLRHYADPVLDQRVRSTPLDAIWSHQKIPMTSQLLAFELRRLGGAGIILPSTKRPSDQSVAFFFSSDEECHGAFNSQRINSTMP